MSTSQPIRRLSVGSLHTHPRPTVTVSPDIETSPLNLNHHKNLNEIIHDVFLDVSLFDIALYNRCVYECQMKIDEIRCLNPRFKILPFNSAKEFMITANRFESHRNTILILILMKGASEIVIQRCSTYKTNDGQIVPLTIDIKEKVFHGRDILHTDIIVLFEFFPYLIHHDLMYRILTLNPNLKVTTHIQTSKQFEFGFGACLILWRTPNTQRKQSF
ncbi:unnamed protein product [Adineta ricciae]|uniref:Uncharacterized protein n=1 Tax=Adineta ricciae TaxID=249248 RepID=A0A815XJQ1_ADIRI|nr:unnamed protein product [Adineta ricciae]CAF1558263.1 unnamed protein product [Adineta ricciae]